jgi:hypothetical protein
MNMGIIAASRLRKNIAFDFSEATPSDQIVELNTRYSKSLWFKNDGLKMYTNYNYQWSLSESWDLSTLSAVGSAGSSLVDDGLSSSNDGIYFYSCSGGIVRQHTLSNPWDLTSATLTNEIDLTSVGISRMRGLQISPDGTTLIIASDTNNKQINQITLSTAFDLSTYSSLISIHGFVVNVVHDMHVSPDGKFLFILDDGEVQSKFLHCFKLNTGWDISSLDSLLYKLNLDGRRVNSLYIREDGRKFWISDINFSPARLVEYSN